MPATGLSSDAQRLQQHPNAVAGAHAECSARSLLVSMTLTAISAATRTMGSSWCRPWLSLPLGPHRLHELPDRGRVGRGAGAGLPVLDRSQGYPQGDGGLHLGDAVLVAPPFEFFWLPRGIFGDDQDFSHDRQPYTIRVNTTPHTLCG